MAADVASYDGQSVVESDDGRSVVESDDGRSVVASDGGPSVVESNSGQSVIEFLLMLPLMVGLAAMIVKTNTAVQASINNQRYARAHALWLAFNSAVYPERKFRFDTKTGEAKSGFRGYNQMILGVSGNNAPDQESGEQYVPEAQTINIQRSGGPKGSNEERAEPELRNEIRVRTTVTLCTQSNWVTKDFLPLSLAGSMNLESLPFDEGYRFCRGPYE